VEYFGFLVLVFSLVLVVLGASWQVFIWSFLILFGVFLFIAVRVCWSWIDIHDWGIEAHSGFYRVKLDYGTFVVVCTACNDSMHTYRLVGCAGDVYVKFTVPDDFRGMDIFRCVCRNNGISLDYQED